VDLATGVQAVTGIKFRWTTPGEGVVILDARQISFNADGSVIFIRGPHDTFEPGAGVFCAALD
jgi:hypothetical protein